MPERMKRLPVLMRWRSPLILTLLGLLFFADLLLHPSRVLYADHSDLLAMHLPAKRFLVRSWQETGEVPLWCPYSFGGTPFVHDVQVGAFYPLHWPLYVLPEERVGAAMNWLVVLHVLIAGWCMYAYACSQGLKEMGALVAALGYMFAGKWLLHILAGGHYIMIPLAWLPLVLLLLENALRRRSLLAATWAGVVYALIVLATHPQMTLYAGVFIGLWTLGTALEQAGHLAGEGPRSGRRTAASLACWAALGAWTVVVAAALSAIQLLPAMEAAAESSRGVGVAASELLKGSLAVLFGVVGAPLFSEWEYQGGIGVLWAATAILAPVIGRGRVRYQAVVAVVLILFATGGAVLFQALPGFRLFILPARMLMLAALPVALLAGFTTQSLFTGPARSPDQVRPLRRLWLVVALALLVLPAAMAAMLYGHQPLAFHLYWVVLPLSLPVAFWLLGDPGSSRARWAWPAVLLVDLWALTWPQVAVRPEAEVYAVSDCVKYLVEQKEKDRAEHWRVLDRSLPGAPSSAPVGAALPMLKGIGLEPVLGYNSFDVHRYKEYLQLIAGKDDPVLPRENPFGYPIIDPFPIRNKPLLDLLGTRYLVQPSDAYWLQQGRADALASKLDKEYVEKYEELLRDAWWAPMRLDAGWWKVQDDPQPVTYSFLMGGVQALPPFRVYRNLEAFPRAFIVQEAAPLPERSRVLPVLEQTNFYQKVLLEPYPGPFSFNGEGASRTVRIKDYQPNRMTLTLDGAGGGFLVLTDVWFPGWTCLVDGESVPVYRANFLFRAVVLPANAREVEFTFAPASYQLGKRISHSAVIAVLGLSVLALALPRLRRRPAH